MKCSKCQQLYTSCIIIKILIPGNLEPIEIVSTNELNTFSYFIKYNCIWSIRRSLPQNYISQGGVLSFLFYIKQIKLKKIKRGNFGQSDT